MIHSIKTDALTSNIHSDLITYYGMNELYEQ